MVYEKTYLGDCAFEEKKVAYYMIQHKQYFGVAIEETKGSHTSCEHVYFTEEEKEAQRMAKILCLGQVTQAHLSYIIDDYIN